MRAPTHLRQAAEQTTKATLACNWWRGTLQLWDHIPAEHILVHPRLVWEDLFTKSYAEEILCTSSTPPYRATKTGKAPGTWFAARKKVTPSPPVLAK